MGVERLEGNMHLIDSITKNYFWQVKTLKKKKDHTQILSQEVVLSELSFGAN
jgi:hypothetical protein